MTPPVDEFTDRANLLLRVADAFRRQATRLMAERALAIEKGRPLVLDATMKSFIRIDERAVIAANAAPARFIAEHPELFG